MPLPLCVRVNARDTYSCEALRSDGWRAVETLLTFEGPRPPLYIGPGLRRGTQTADLDMALGMVESTGRLFSDPEIEWVDARTAKKAWVSEAWGRGNFWIFEDKGFAAFRPPNIVDFVCVKGGHKERGIGSWLLSAAPYAELVAGTAKTNHAAAMFYISLGWRLIKKERTWHK